jgi:hypothetical protein
MRENYAGKDHPGYLQDDAAVLRKQILEHLRLGLVGGCACDR